MTFCTILRTFYHWILSYKVSPARSFRAGENEASIHTPVQSCLGMHRYAWVWLKAREWMNDKKKETLCKQSERCHSGRGSIQYSVQQNVEELIAAARVLDCNSSFNLDRFILKSESKFLKCLRLGPKLYCIFNGDNSVASCLNSFVTVQTIYPVHLAKMLCDSFNWVWSVCASV
jgi:hypothetical protein